MRGSWHRLLALALVLAGLLLLAGCEASQQQFVLDWAQEWARSKNLHPRNEDGSINIRAAINLGLRAAGASTGDPDADAALDAFLVVKKINDADNLMDKGRQEHDPAPMDEAIKMRPGDWTYRLSRGTLALDQHDYDTAQTHFDEADRIAAERGIDPIWYAGRNIAELQALYDERLQDGIPMESTPQCRPFWERLAQSYELRWQATKDEADQAAAADARQRAEACGQ